MEPKDLKNSEELKRTENKDIENSDQNDDSNTTKKKTDKETEPEKDTASSVPSEESSELANSDAKDENKTSEMEKSSKTEKVKDKEPKVEKKEEGETISAKKKKVSAEEQTDVTKVESDEPADKKGKEEKNTEVEPVIKDIQQDPLTEESKEEKSQKTENNDEAASDEKLKDKKEQISATQQKEKKPRQEDKPDYSTFNQVELVNALRDVLDSNGDHDIKDDVEAIKSAFYKQRKEEAENEKNEFIKNGGDAEDFEPKDSPYEKDIKELLKKYRQIRIEYNKKLDQEKEKNVERKYQIIEEIKGLINTEESINKTFNEFRDLQQQWREIGLVPQSKMKDLWENYHFHVENFYDYIKINKELRDLDLKKNLEMKIKLCEQAEELLLETNIIKAFNSLQKLHDRYREIGPVPRENKDDLWERFKAATTKINKKHQEYFEERKEEQKKNLEAKRALCEQVEEINELDLNTHQEWNEKSKEVVNIQKVWRTIGFAPRKDNNKIYDRFRKSCDAFFDAKREFYSKNKELQQNNLQAKIDLCMQAEALKDSTDWKKTTQDFINIQKKWKEIGPVPRKQSDVIWKRFRTACDYFFDQKSDHFSNIDTEQVENLKKKEQLIEDIKKFKSKGDVDENLKILKELQRRWTEIGHVPFKKKDEVQKNFRESINKLYDDLNIDEQKRNLLKFRSKMSSFSESYRGQNKMRMEREKYMNKLKQLENDLVLLDNNIGFFAKSKNAESLIKDVNKKIEGTKQKIEFLKDKIRVIDEMDQSE